MSILLVKFFYYSFLVSLTLSKKLLTFLLNIYSKYVIILSAYFKGVYMNRIKILREELGLTQKELSNKLNLSEGSISLYEKEDRKPSLEVLLKLSEIFNCSIDYILGKSDIRNLSDIDFDKDELFIALSQEDKGFISDEIKNEIAKYARYVIEEEKRKNSQNHKEN